MRKLNNKGYMLVEIILAFVISFAILYFMMDLVIKLKNKNDDLLVETVVKTDSSIITNKLMEYAIRDVDSNDTAKEFCRKIEDNIDLASNTIKYGDEVINVLDDTSKIVIVNKDDICNVDEDDGKVSVRIPVEVKQNKDRNFNIEMDYNYVKKNACLIDYNYNNGCIEIPKQKNMVTSYICDDKNGNLKQVGDDPYFKYTGRCEVIDDGNGDWRIKFLTDGEFTSLKSDLAIDVFLVGGGGGGGTLNYGGGGGGYTTTTFAKIKGNTSYSIDIGAGGISKTDGKATIAFGAIAFGGRAGTYGQGGNGGSGGGDSGKSAGSNGNDGKGTGNGGTGQRTTTCEFGENGCADSLLYSGGGGGYSNTGTDGGVGGGADGGKTQGISATANTGGGGGSGYNSGGTGGSGIVVIRNYRGNSLCNMPGVNFDFSYSGNYIILNDGAGNWRIKFLTSGTFISSSDLFVDAFLVGGGGGGGGSNIYAGGGGGGYTSTSFVKILKNKEYYISIGEGGTEEKNGKKTTGFGAIAFGGRAGTHGQGGNGGSGGGDSGKSAGSNGNDGKGTGNGGTGQRTTTCEFGESGCTIDLLYSGGGGGFQEGLGGNGGGGNGGPNNDDGYANNGINGRGGGGGGGRNNGGTGGSGIVVIRNYRGNSLCNMPKVDFDFSYSGNYLILDDGNGDWRIKFLTSGTFISSSDLLIDAFLVGGGGGGGGHGIYTGGGGGGYTTSTFAKILKNKQYYISIGKGGEEEVNGEATTGFGAIAYGGNFGWSFSAGSGGSGGGRSGFDGGKDGNDVSNGGDGQEITTCEFGESGCTIDLLYSGGGGGFEKGLGGNGGGGNGGPNNDNGYGNDGINGRGGGGGGGRNNGGTGGSGVVVIRNYRGSNASKLPGVDFDFEYDGYYSVIDDGNGNWRIKFLTSGILKSDKNLNIDAFLVGGGGGGGTDLYSAGGGGGYTQTQLNLLLNNNIEYTIEVGDGGNRGKNGGTSSISGSDLTTINAFGGKFGGGNGKYGGNGGSGGGASTQNGGGSDGSNGGGPRPGIGQGTTTCEFGLSGCGKELLYAGGGGGFDFGTGGLGGGGGGGHVGHANNGIPNKGGGGGGSGNGNGLGGSGGSGIVIIRNKR